MRYDRIEIGNRIYIARKRKNLKQYEMCQLLNISQSTYSKIENGKYDIPLSVLFNISEILNVSINWLLCVDEYSEFTHEEELEIEKFKRYIISIRKM